MTDLARGGTFERDIEQAIVALKKGAYLLKYGRKGKPRFCPFRLSSDEKTLIWYSGKEEMQLSLSSVTRIVPGQRTANFQRNPQPEKEYQSFSLIYGHDEQSLDLICKDKDQAELWFIGIKALINCGQSHRVRVDIKNDGPLCLDTSSPTGYLRRKVTLGSAFIASDGLHQQEFMDAYRFESSFGSPLHHNSENTYSTGAVHSLHSRKSYPDSCSLAESLHSAEADVGSESLKLQCKDNSIDTFRVSLSSIISSSSQGSAQDDGDALGDVYMWGEGIGDGILGGGGQRVENMAGALMDALVPKQLDSAVVLDVQNIACGRRHAALVTRQGEVFCWGEESGGRLGHGIDADVPHPQLVETLACSNTELVACGEYHTCAVTLCGDLYTWGDGSRCPGLLGHGNDISHWMPRRVTLPDGIRVSSVACGPWHTAIITSAGQLFTFGDGTFGVLGHGDKQSLSYPREVESLKGLKTVRVACGVWHSAAIVEVITGYSGGTCSSGKLFTWGDGDKGCLGHGQKATKLIPTCVASLVDYDFRQVSCGHSLTVALTIAGQVYTMGSSIFGQLGDPKASGHFPGLVEGKLWEAFVEEIACGAYHVAVLTSRMDVYTWGKGANGRLGHGDVQDRHTPTIVEKLKDKQVKSIACGSNFTAAICLHKLFSGADQSLCSGCRMPFAFTRKRHNCYNCGHAFCHACSNKKATRATLAPTPRKPYRVCDPCYMSLKVAAEAGAAANVGTLRKGIMMQQSLHIKELQDKTEVRHHKTHLSTPRLPLVEHSKQVGGRFLSKQSRKHESLRRVSPAPTDLIPWGHTSMPSMFEPRSALVKPPMSPFSVVSSRKMDVVSLPVSRHQSPPRLGLTPSGFWSQDSVINDLKETNSALSEEVLKLRKQIETLVQHCQVQEAELQQAAKEIQRGKLVAGEEAVKCKAAKEVIKSLTLQLKDMAGKMPPRLYSNYGVDPCHSPQVSANTGVNLPVGMPANRTMVLDSPKRTSQTVRIIRDADDTGATSPYATPNGALHLPSQILAQEVLAGPRGQDRHRDAATFCSGVSVPNGHHAEHHVEKEWVEQDDPGVYITFVNLPGGGKDLKRVRFRDISAFMSQAMEMLWKTKAALKALRLMRMEMVCSPRMHGGLNILNIRYHVLARKATLLHTFFCQQQPWTCMLASMCASMSTSAYGHWITDFWEVVIGRFVGRIPGCPFSTALILDWKQVLSKVKWAPGRGSGTNSMRKESIHWSAIFDIPLALQEPVRAYNLMKLGIRYIQDVVDDRGYTLSFPRAMTSYALEMHHRFIWNKIADLLNPFLPIPPMIDTDRLTDWQLHSSTTCIRPVSLSALTSSKVYKLLQPVPWIQQHANTLWHLAKSLAWWRKNLRMLWKCKMPLKQRLFLWRCLTGTLSVGVTLAKRHIASSTCLRCLAPSETIPHLFWHCPCSRILLKRISDSLRLRFPSHSFGKHFWLFGRFKRSLSQYSLFLYWVRYWALWIIWSDHNLAHWGRQNYQQYESFRASLRQSLYDACYEGDMDASCIELFFSCF